MDDEQLSEVLDAMFEKKAEVGETIITQVNSRGEISTTKICGGTNESCLSYFFDDPKFPYVAFFGLE